MRAIHQRPRHLANAYLALRTKLVAKQRDLEQDPENVFLRGYVAALAETVVFLYYVTGGS